jgi:AcrR family transcriptional regulator
MGPKSIIERALLGESAEDDATDRRILDGALAEVAAQGARRTTVDDVARRAGVGRVTVFRRMGTKDELLERLFAREVRRFLREVDAALDGVGDPAERVAEAFVACVRAGVEHPLVSRLARLEPGVALERLAQGSPSPLDLGRAYVAARIEADRAGGARPGATHGSAEEIADVLVRLAVTYVLVPTPVFDVRDEAAARDFARRLLAPIVTA